MENKQIPTWEQLEERIGRKLYSFNELRSNKAIGFDTTTFNNTIKNNGEWLKKMCYQIGVDVMPKTGRSHRTQYAIDGERLIAFLEEHKRVAEIAPMLGVFKGTLGSYIEKGFFGEKLKEYPIGDGSSLYNVNFILEMYEEVRNKAAENRKSISNRESIYSQYISDEIISEIEGYISHRLSPAPGISIAGVLMSKSGFKNEEIAERHKSQLHSIFFEINCLLQGVNINEFKDQLRMRRQTGELAQLLEGVDKNHFLLPNFDHAVVSMLSKGLKQSTLQTYIHDFLRPFYYYHLMMQEKRLFKNIRKSELSLDKRYILKEDFEMLKMSILDIFNQFQKVNSQPDQKKKAFLDREQYAKLFRIVFTKHGIDKAVALELSFRVGLRAKEASLIAVEDFWIDDNGYLMTDDFGYGKLHLPAAKAKAGVDGGAEERGILVPPSTVKLINEYLKTELYPKSPFENHKKSAGLTFRAKGKVKTYPDGHGYLLRTKVFMDMQDNPISKSEIGKFLRKLRSELAFLNQSQRQHLSFHDGRHSLNEWIETAIVGPKLQPFVDMVADFQMHHTPGSSDSGRKDVGKTNYRSTEILETYRDIIDKSINFPLDLEELRKWEIAHLYREEHETTIQLVEGISKIINTNDVTIKDPFEIKKPVVKPLSDAEKNHLLNELNIISGKLKSTIQRPKDMTAIEWTKLRVALNEKKMEIEGKLQAN